MVSNRAYEELVDIRKELQTANNLKRQELKQQMFFIELIEEVLPLNDNVKRNIHMRNMGYYD